MKNLNYKNILLYHVYINNDLYLHNDLNTDFVYNLIKNKFMYYDLYIDNEIKNDIFYNIIKNKITFTDFIFKYYKITLPQVSSEISSSIPIFALNVLY